MVKLIFVACCFLTLSVFASQEFSVSDGDTIEVKISEKDATRFLVEKGRISRLWGVNTDSGFIIKEDKDQGEIFIAAKNGSPKTTSFFIRDEFGNTYTVIASKFDIPSQTVVLSPTKRATLKFQEMPFVKRIKSLVKVMGSDNTTDQDIAIKKINKEVSLWKETEITLIGVYTQNDLEGDKYILKNTTKNQMVLSENEFLNFGNNVIAVAITKPTLVQDEASFVFVIRKK